VPNDQMKGSQFSSWNISLPYRRYGCASFLCIALAGPTPEPPGVIGNWPNNGKIPDSRNLLDRPLIRV
jgi:hypothetical protein